jgi:hypothetical protein
MLFLSNLFNMTIFMSVNLTLILLSNLLQTIWDRNFGRSKDPVLWIFASFFSIMAFSITTLVWGDPSPSSGLQKPTFLIAMGWAFSVVGTTLIATLLSVMAAERVTLFVG